MPHQLCLLKAGDGSEVRIIETVADDDWCRLAEALGFDGPTRVSIATQASFKPDIACIGMFDHWLQGGQRLKPATWSTLMWCLNNSDFTDLARKVKEFIL